jgi:hypothetical protein
LANRAGILSFFGFVRGAFLDAHISEFAGFEDFAAFEAFHELGVLVTAYNLHAWMFARLFVRVVRVRKRLRGHKSETMPSSNTRGGNGFAGISRYFSPAFVVVKWFDAGGL